MRIKMKDKNVKRRILRIFVIISLILGALFVSSCVSCASYERCAKDCSSEINNGIYREINIYTYEGELIAHYEGKMDIETNNSNYIVFHINGKRYIYYYGIGIIEVIEK